MYIRSTLFDILEAAEFHKWHDEAEKDASKIYDDAVQKYKKLLIENIKEDKIVYIDKFRACVESREIEIYFHLCTRILNMGVKIGMELGRAFEDIDNGSF